MKIFNYMNLIFIFTLQAQDFGTISGFVRDEATGEPLSYANVFIKDINILTDPMIRVKLSEHSGWPTIPQLFVKGKLIGGADITMELHNNGELLDMLDVSKED